jgi:TIR domain
MHEASPLPLDLRPGAGIFPQRLWGACMSAESTKPVIFISYAHDDKEWLNFVLRFLQLGEKDGLFCIWTDRLIEGGADWKPEIEAKLRACDIFILLVSSYSMASDFIIDMEIAIIRERQAKREPVHFYPLLMAPTPDAGLKKVDDKNLRPSREKPFSGYGTHEREDLMSKAADEIARIAKGTRVKARIDDLSAGPDLRIDGRIGFKMRTNDLRNPVGSCAELIPRTSHASTYERFDLLPELRCGMETVEVDSIDFSFGVSQIKLRFKLSGCEIAPGARLGDRDHPFIRAEGRRAWIITGPTNENNVLWRRVLGDDVLCSIKPMKNDRYNIIMEACCRNIHIIYDITYKDRKRMNINKERILGIFLNQCLESDDGFVKLCSADFDVLEVRHDP